MRAHIVRGIPEGAEFSEQFLALRHIGVVAFVVSDESPRMIHRADNGAGIDFDMSRLAQDVLSLARSSTANQVHRFGAQLRTLNDKLMTSLTLFLLLSSRTPLFLEFAWRPSLAADRRTLPNHTRFPIRGASGRGPASQFQRIHTANGAMGVVTCPSDQRTKTTERLFCPSDRESMEILRLCMEHDPAGSEWRPGKRIGNGSAA